MEEIWEQLKKIDILDIYDEIAEIPITDDQVKRACLTIPCTVDLRSVNLVYAAERKYKHKIDKYRKDKNLVLKWLNINLPIILTNPEARYLRWHERHQRKFKIAWINRKAHILQPLPPPIFLENSETNEDEIQQSNNESKSIGKIFKLKTCRVRLRRILPPPPPIKALLPLANLEDHNNIGKTIKLKRLRVKLPRILPDKNYMEWHTKQKHQKRLSIIREDIEKEVPSVSRKTENSLERMESSSDVLNRIEVAIKRRKTSKEVPNVSGKTETCLELMESSSDILDRIEVAIKRRKISKK